MLKTTDFARRARRLELPDFALRGILVEMASGLPGESLGGGLYKKRIALPGRGKRGGGRVVIATKLGSRWILFDVYAKNARADVTPLQLRQYKRQAKQLLGMSDEELCALVNVGALERVDFA